MWFSWAVSETGVADGWLTEAHSQREAVGDERRCKGQRDQIAVHHQQHCQSGLLFDGSERAPALRGREITATQRLA
jgi:hypothetical protein